ncbi:MAG: GAF domain-containing protein [Anaerolineae bacterium]|nr:GAF domain-containing protein [Anaerolineae bacterium]
MEEIIQQLEHELALQKRAFEMIMAIDHIRDSTAGPEAMLSGIVNLLVKQFGVELCLLYLINRETQELELKVVETGVNPWWVGLDSFQSLAARAIVEGKDNVDGVLFWQAQDILEAKLLTTLPQTAQFIAIPIIMEEHPLGALLMAHSQRSFDVDDLQLLEIAESQIDSAVIQAYAAHELTQRNKELETLYRVDQIRDQNLPFDEMLSLVLQELRNVIQAKMGFVMLYDRHGDRLEMRAITHDDLVNVPAYYETINRVANEAIQSGELICYHQKGESSCTLICIPLILRNEILGVFGAVNPASHKTFSNDDQRLLRAIVSQMDTAILESMERRRLRRVLGRSVDPHVLQKLLADPNVDLLEGERLLLTVLYGDLRGSTALAERLDPEILVEFINDYLGRMTEVVLAYGGTLDKFVGDEVMALFGAPIPQSDHALRAVQVGLAMQERHKHIMEQWQARGVETAGLGIGIATGELIVGEIGCEQRTDYTVIGPAANLGSRICGTAKAGQVLISPATYALISEQSEVVAIPGQRFKGIDHEITVYNVTRVS